MTTMPARSTIYRLLAIDIDGTLVNSRDELTPDTQEALIRAGRAGIQVVLATGRRYSRTLHLVEPLGIDVPLITASGALVKDPKDHRTLHKTTFDPQLLRQILKLIDQGGYDPLLCADTFAEGFDFYLARQKVKTPELQEYLDLNPNDGRIWPNMINDPPPDVFLVFTMGTKDQMLIMEQILHGDVVRPDFHSRAAQPALPGILGGDCARGRKQVVGRKTAGREFGDRGGVDLRGGRRRERHPHDSRRRLGRGHGQRPARGKSRRRPRRAHPRRKRIGASGGVAAGINLPDQRPAQV